jgi:hypothetical protein
LLLQCVKFAVICNPTFELERLMKALHRALFSLATATAFCLPIGAQAEVFASAAAPGQCLANSGGSPVVQGCAAGASAQNISMPYKAGENLFFGQLKIGGQCLDAAGAKLVFTTCKPGDAQVWKLTGNTGKINNGQNNCVAVSGGSVTTVPCSQGGAGLTWWNQSATSAKIIAIPGMKSVAAGTKLSVMNGNIVAGGAGNIVAAGAGNIVAGGAGNIVAGGAGNLVIGFPWYK